MEPVTNSSQCCRRRCTSWPTCWRCLRPGPTCPKTAKNFSIYSKNHTYRWTILVPISLSSIVTESRFKGLLCAHDSVAQKDYYPHLPEIPQDTDEDEETVKIVQLVKSNEPLVSSHRTIIDLIIQWWLFRIQKAVIFNWMTYSTIFIHDMFISFLQRLGHKVLNRSL